MISRRHLRRGGPAWGRAWRRAGGPAGAAALLLAAGALVQAQQPAAPGDDPCAALAGRAEVAARLLGLPDAATVLTQASAVGASAALPAFCRVRGYVQPQVGFELRLPLAGWNGRLLMQGCGGMCGFIKIEAADDALARGYAVVSTDMGHKGTGSSAAWAYDNRAAEIDFGWRATHVVAVAAKALIDLYYARPPERAYFRGCSTGGRQGLVAAQRFPQDFDGIIAGAPVLDETGVAALHLLWSARTNLDAARRPILDAAKLPALRAAVLEACDALDGVRDGVLQEPTACGFDPRQMLCPAGQSRPDCLTPAEADVVARIYAGFHDASGRRAFTGGMSRGSEYEWAPAFIGAQGRAGLIVERDTLVSQMLQFMVFDPDPGPGYSVFDFDFERDPPRLALTEPLYSARNPDLRAFRDRGGKLLVYHGWDDLEIPPALTLDYHEVLTRTMGGPQATGEFLRLFMVPGMAHCRRGPGADAIDYLSALEQWDATGTPPGQLLAHRLQKPQSYDGLPVVRFPLPPDAYEWSRPVPAWPAVAAYDGRGDWRDPARWRPRQPRASLEERRAWLESVDAQDHLFWRRFLAAPSGTFARNWSWYAPSEPVIGALQPFFPTAAQGERTIDAAALDAAADYAFARSTTVLYVLHRGRLQLARFAPGHHHESFVSGRSMTKSLAGMLAGIALAEGKLRSLDDPLGQYLQEWRDDPRGRITLRQLLHNVSGLEVPPPVRDPANKEIRLIDGTDVRSAALAFELIRTPGEAFAHANVNTQLLALAIEHATGERYAQYLSRRLWQPLGASRAALRLDAFDGRSLAFCCSQTAPSDWLRLGALLLADGRGPGGERILPPGWVSEMRRGSRANPNYGLHLWVGTPFTPRRPYLPDLPQVPANVHSEAFAALDLFYLDGGGKLRVWIVPSRELVVVRLGEEPREPFDEAFIPNTIIRGIVAGAE